MSQIGQKAFYMSCIFMNIELWYFSDNLLLESIICLGITSGYKDRDGPLLHLGLSVVLPTVPGRKSSSQDLSQHFSPEIF